MLIPPRDHQGTVYSKYTLSVTNLSPCTSKSRGIYQLFTSTAFLHIESSLNSVNSCLSSPLCTRDKNSHFEFFFCVISFLCYELSIVFIQIGPPQIERKNISANYCHLAENMLFFPIILSFLEN